MRQFYNMLIDTKVAYTNFPIAQFQHGNSSAGKKIFYGHWVINTPVYFCETKYFICIL